MATSSVDLSSLLRRPLFSPPPFFSSSSSSPPSIPFFNPRRRSLIGAPSSLSSSSSSSSRISTVPTERSPPHSSDHAAEIGRLDALRSRLQRARSLNEKLRVLESDSRVREFFGPLRRGVTPIVLFQLDVHDVFLLKCLVAAGQAHVLGVNHVVSGKGGASLKSAFYVLADMIEKWNLKGNGNGNGNGNGLGHEGIGDGGSGEMAALRRLLGILDEVERFYDCVGGIIGYQIMVLEQLSYSKAKSRLMNLPPHLNKMLKSQVIELHVPSGLDLSENTEYASQAALWGLEGLPELGEIYPIGGAGDRLGLIDSRTGECLPAALLPYCGRTLLEGLIRDLQAREFLHFKVYGKQCITPVAIMTSSVKDNTKHINTLCEKLGWFGRGRHNFKLFQQPLVPVVSAADGQWLLSRALTPVCKPGGHGAIWKLAYDKGVFQWFYSHGRKGATVRQVSNVVAATDLTLLALAGLGLRHKKKLGFASCQRNSGATEGINVLVEKRNHDGKWSYGLTCIEYTEFEKYDIMDAHTSCGSHQVEFPANTNILYVDLQSAEKIGSSQDARCLPGTVLNLKKPVSYVDHLGFQRSIPGGRMECTMQNIADNFLNTYTSRRSKDIESTLDTFIVYNERKRVTSSAKRKRKVTDNSLHQTPDGALLDVMRNASDLLSCCNIKIPMIEDNSKYLYSGPPFLIFIHPALGPLWEVTRQKTATSLLKDADMSLAYPQSTEPRSSLETGYNLAKTHVDSIGKFLKLSLESDPPLSDRGKYHQLFNGGSISKGSELQIEIAELLWRDVQLDGSLIVTAENIMGSIVMNETGEQILQYGHRCGRCKLYNVKVLNRGIDWTVANNIYWKHDIQRLESLKIVLHGNAEFEASDVVLQGNHVFEVPSGYRMRIVSDNPGFVVNLDHISEEMMDSGSWFWKYKIKDTHIHLEMIELQSP